LKGSAGSVPPEILLSYRSNSWSWLQPVTEVGTVPLILLWYTWKVVMFSHAPIAFGSVPTTFVRPSFLHVRMQGCVGGCCVRREAAGVQEGARLR
jgi:hypothetical protein